MKDYGNPNPISKIFKTDSLYPEIKQTCIQERYFFWNKQHIYINFNGLPQFAPAQDVIFKALFLFYNQYFTEK